MQCELVLVELGFRYFHIYFHSDKRMVLKFLDHKVENEEKLKNFV